MPELGGYDAPKGKGAPMPSAGSGPRTFWFDKGLGAAAALAVLYIIGSSAGTYYGTYTAKRDYEPPLNVSERELQGMWNSLQDRILSFPDLQPKARAPVYQTIISDARTLHKAFSSDFARTVMMKEEINPQLDALYDDRNLRPYTRSLMSHIRLLKFPAFLRHLQRLLPYAYKPRIAELVMQIAKERRDNVPFVATRDEIKSMLLEYRQAQSEAGQLPTKAAQAAATAQMNTSFETALFDDYISSIVAHIDSADWQSFLNRVDAIGRAAATPPPRR